jgi:glycosyltransferase involved in cell wall biosynthesis
MQLNIGFPVYNQPFLFRDCFCSIISQNVANVNYHVVDDAGTVDYEKVLSEFKVERINYYRNNKNIGGLSNMQYSFKVAARDGEFVMVMHEDDLLAPGFFKAVSDEIKLKQVEPKLILSFFKVFGQHDNIDFSNFNREEIKAIWWSKKQLVEAFLNLQPIAFGSAIYNTAYYRDMHLDVNKYGEFADRPFLLSALTDQDKVLVIPTPMYYYRDHGPLDQRWKKLTSDHVFELLQLYKGILRPSNRNERSEYTKQATGFIFDSHNNLVLSGNWNGWWYYLITAWKRKHLSIKYAFLRVPSFNRFLTFILK